MNTEFDDIEMHSSFDIKAFFFRVLSFWKLFVLGLIIGFFIVYQKNIREEFSYRLGTKISIEDDSNPLFTSNTSLTFNWGGVTAKVQTMVVTLKSRTHHEKVVDRLQFYMYYLKEGRFRKQDIYKDAPFRMDLNVNANQLLNLPVKITFLESNKYELEVDFTAKSIFCQNYFTKEKSVVAVKQGVFKKIYNFGDIVDLPFLNGTINKAGGRNANIGDFYFLEFKDFDQVVAGYNFRTSVRNIAGSPIIDLTLVDKNRIKIVDYLNAIVEVLSEDQLNRKNLYATNTIKFINDRLSKVKTQLIANADTLNKYKKSNKIFNLDDESVKLSEKLSKFDEEKEVISTKQDYYNNLRNYLTSSLSLTELPAPSIAGIDDPNILSNVSKINALSVQKANLEYSVKEEASIFDDLNRQIAGLKNVLLENIDAANGILEQQLQIVNSKLAKVEIEFGKLPEEQQKLFSIERQYNLSEQAYNVFLAKRSEADIIKASNVSDIVVIDPAKDTGAAIIGVNLNIRYVFAFFTALILPLLLGFFYTLFDKNIHNPQDVEKLSPIPILGITGINTADNNLVVHKKPKSAVSESFRAIRSSLQYIYKKQKSDGTKTVMVTSSVSGEGKTFCSINIANVFALSNKKTVLLGLDLRKPKIYGDFEIHNNFGVVNYLIGEKSLEEVVQTTQIPNLDIITSGPIPPNPSELLIGEQMDEFMNKIKTKYDYIVLDTPPVGLVSDALELIDYVDATLYIIREDYTKKGILNFINDKYQKQEISNLSFIYNGYNQNTKYGYGYGYNYGYGYGNYANGYHESGKENRNFLGSITASFVKVLEKLNLKR